MEEATETIKARIRQLEIDLQAKRETVYTAAHVANFSYAHSTFAKHPTLCISMHFAFHARQQTL